MAPRPQSPAPPSNRTPDEIERTIIDLASKHQRLGSRRLAELCRRTCGFQLSHQTVRNIIKRRGRTTLSSWIASMALLLICRRFFWRVFGLPKKARSSNESSKGSLKMTKNDEFEIVRRHAARLDAPICEIRDQINAALGTNFTTKSIARAISRNRKLLERLLGRKPRTIPTSRPCELWGIDITEVRVFFVFRIRVLGIIDYFGSRLILLQPLKDVKAESIVSEIEKSFSQYGKSKRFISDRGSVFTGHLFQNFLKNNDIAHTFIRPGHPWTNGRIERLFRTFKTTLAACYPIILGTRQFNAFCSEFVVYYNETRPHSAWNGLTPDELYFRRPRAMHAIPTTFFEGRLEWYRFGD